MCDGDIQQMRAGAPQEPDLHLFVTSHLLGRIASPCHPSRDRGAVGMRQGFLIKPNSIVVVDFFPSLGCGGSSFVMHWRGEGGGGGSCRVIFMRVTVGPWVSPHSEHPPVERSTGRNWCPVSEWGRWGSPVLVPTRLCRKQHGP